MRPFDTSSISPPRDSRVFSLPAGFPAITPVDLEIGCGVGWHSIQYAKKNPGRVLIAIEHTRAKFERFSNRIERNNHPPNLFAVHADAVRWVTHCLAQESIHRCFILYPNPEPKSPSKRWMRMPFMHKLLQVIAPNGEIHLATNELWYFDEALTIAREHWRLDATRTRSFTSQNSLSEIPRTHFEKKYLERGETCFDVIFVKA